LKNIKVIIGGFMSIDGKTAPANRIGRIFTKFMTPQHQKILHRLRASVDAIIIGVDTVLADDPSLTVREVKGKNPIRVVLDSSARTPLTSRILNTEEASTIIVATQKASKEKIEALKSKKVEVIVSSSPERVDLKELTEELKNREIKKVLVEGGGEVRWSFFKENLVDEFFVWIMPYVWGGRNAPTLVDGEGFLKAEDAVPLKLKSMKVVKDILILWFSVKR
jgi:2,5-diamino-6-(ribosylamino)-4(3H)-pyrimidinone 5'-phosphate reductase